MQGICSFPASGCRTGRAVNKRKGRKRKLVIRYPSGRPKQRSSAAREADASSVALEARRRVFGLSETDAKHLQAVDMLGRLRLRDEISETQHAAGQRYAEKRAEYHKTMLAKPVPSAGDLQRQPGFDASDGSEESYRLWCKRVAADFDAMRIALRETDEPLAGSVLDSILDGQPLFNFVGTLRIALNALARITQHRQA